VLTNTVSRALAREYAGAFGIGVLEWRVIAVVGRFEPTTAAQVCQRTAMDKVAVSRAVSSLLRRRLLTRRVDPEDRRRALLSLSRRGREIHDGIAPRADHFQRELLQALDSSEQRQLDRLLSKLAERASGLDADGVPSAPD
jgi:DNA-binding MarR family transcriptional regulator